MLLVRIQNLRRDAIWVVIVSLLLTIGLAQIRTPSATAAPSSFQLPFACQEVWKGATYNNHGSKYSQSSSLPLDLNSDNGDTWENGHSVLASAAGTVVTSSFQTSGYGNYVEIDHGGGWKTLYAHMKIRSVNVGQILRSGTKIGEVGNTGLGQSGVAETHLHYEQVLNGTLQAVTFNGIAFAYSTTYNGNSVTSNNCPRAKTLGDYTGDGIADLAVYSPNDFDWSIRLGENYVYGLSGDIPVPGDYNGDGKMDVAVFRPSSGYWYIRGILDTAYGQTGDIPVPGDYNGDGITEIAVYRPGTGTWHIRQGASIQYGNPGDVPVPADYNGDGITDIAVFRPSDAYWHVRNIFDIAYGQSGDIPVPADYNGDGSIDLAIYRPSGNWWHIRQVDSYQYGINGDYAVPTDYSGDGKADAAVFRPSDGNWHVRLVLDAAYGQAGDIPVVGTLSAPYLKQLGLISSF